MHDVHLYQLSTKSNFASQGIFASIQGWFGCHIRGGTAGVYRVGVRGAAEHPAMPRTAHRKELSSPKCQEYPDGETLVYVHDEDDNFHMNSFNK